jgi:hypothetical protein
MAPGAEMTYGVTSSYKVRAGKLCDFGSISSARIWMAVSKIADVGNIMGEPANQTATIQQDTPPYRRLIAPQLGS